MRAKVVVFGKSGFTPAKWLYSGEVVVLGQNGCFWAKWLYSVKGDFIQAKVVVIGQSCCILAKVVVFGQIHCI